MQLSRVLKILYFVTDFFWYFLIIFTVDKFYFPEIFLNNINWLDAYWRWSYLWLNLGQNYCCTYFKWDRKIIGLILSHFFTNYRMSRKKIKSNLICNVT